jgi:predicted TPR repeat methyltransferase
MDLMFFFDKCQKNYLLSLVFSHQRKKPGRPMIQNIYDNPQFFTVYKEFRDNDKGYNESIEVPAMKRLMKDIKGARVLDLGCGLGHQVGYLIEQDAENIIAVDVSQRMVEECRKRFQLPNVSFICEAIENFNMGIDQYNIVVSSMAFHYINDLDTVFSNVYNALKRKGQFIFSIEHPICTACQIGWLDAHGMPNRLAAEGL